MVDTLVTNFICHFSIPIELHSDQGPNFESRLMQEVLEQMGVSMGWEATHLPVGLPSINQWNHWCACQHVARPRALPALWPYGQGSPRQVNDRIQGQICQTAIWHPPSCPPAPESDQWPDEGTIQPAGQLLVFKKVKEWDLPPTHKRRPPKLQTYWEGPYIIIQINDIIYQIQQYPSAKMIIVHLDRLMPYLGATQDK